MLHILLLLFITNNIRGKYCYFLKK